VNTQPQLSPKNVIIMQTSSSSEYHTFYLKTASDIETVTQPWLQKNISLLPPHISPTKSYPKYSKKVTRWHRKKEEKYSFIHLLQNL